MGKEQPENIRVWVKKDTSKPDGVDFSFTSNLGSGDKLKFNNPEVGDWFKLSFHIVDDDKTGYRFPSDLNEAMWVHTVDDEKGPCPEPYSKWGQFTAKEVKSANKILVVDNLNEDKQKFKFALRFSKEKNFGPPYVMWDPIGDNRNGGSVTNPGGGGGGLAATLGPVGIAIAAVGILAVAFVAFRALS